jgi:hypothetical protein
MQSKTSADTESNITNIRKDNIFSNSGVSGDVFNIGEAGGDVTLTDGGAVSAALEANQQVSATAFEKAFGFGTGALQTVSDSVKEGFTANKDVVSDFLDSFDWQQQQQRQGIERALASVDSAKTNDGAETMQSAFQWTAIAVAVGAGSYFFSRMGD